jgi:Uma2 family endonuclease
MLERRILRCEPPPCWIGDKIMATKSLLTVEEFDQLPEREDVTYELDEGELIIMARPRPRHNLVRENLAYHLGALVRQRNLGSILLETEFQLSEDTVRIPDIAFLTTERMRDIDLDRLIEGAPTLAVEVVSPTDLAEDLTRKVDQYIKAGSRPVWVLYLKAREVHIFRAGEVRALRGADEVLEDQEILPGFSLSLASLFEAK